MTHRPYVKNYVKNLADLTPAEAAARTDKLAEARMRALQARAAKTAPVTPNGIHKQ